MNREEQAEFDRLRKGLERAKDIIEKQQAQLRELDKENNGVAPALLYCPVIDVKDARMLILNQDSLLEISRPLSAVVRVGDTVAITPDFEFVRSLGSEVPKFGSIGVVRRLIGRDAVEVTIDGKTQVSLRGNVKVEEGDRVVLGTHDVLLMDNLGKIENRFTFSESTNIQWSDIHGQDAAIAAMVEAIEWPHTHRKIYERYNKKPINGVLLYGPPGCGKTMLAQAAATSAAKRAGKAGQAGFLSVKGSEVLDRWVGSTEETIRSLFASARAHYLKNGFPAVIFIDEADAILGSRGNGISSDMEKTVVPAFLSEMNGLSESGALVILATNRPDTLDSAITRDKRIDRKVHVQRPDKTNTEKLFAHYLRGVPLHKWDHDEAAKFAATEMFKDSYVVQQIEHVRLTLGQLASGALVAGIVDRATSLAVSREVKATNNVEPGVRKQDILAAISSACRENKDLDHRDDLLPLILQSRTSEAISRATKNQLAS